MEWAEIAKGELIQPQGQGLPNNYPQVTEFSKSEEAKCMHEAAAACGLSSINAQGTYPPSQHYSSRYSPDATTDPVRDGTPPRGGSRPSDRATASDHLANPKSAGYPEQTRGHKSYPQTYVHRKEKRGGRRALRRRRGGGGGPRRRGTPFAGVLTAAACGGGRGSAARIRFGPLFNSSLHAIAISL